MTIDYSTKSAAEDAAVDLRQRHDALDWEASVDDLIRAEGLSQDIFSPWTDGGMSRRVREAISKSTKKVKAVIAVKEQLILIAHDLPKTKTPFAKGHELGHSTLPWHREILYVCDEHDLNPGTRDQMEFEANAFSSEVLLPSPLLANVYKNYPVSMETVLLLHEWSDASIEACAIKYVTNHPGECVLLMLEDSVDEDGAPVLKLLRKTLSRKAVRSNLSTIETGRIYSQSHSLYRESRGTKVMETPLSTNDVSYTASLLNNTYKVLALIHR